MLLEICSVKCISVDSFSKELALALKMRVALRWVREILYDGNIQTHRPMFDETGFGGLIKNYVRIR